MHLPAREREARARLQQELLHLPDQPFFDRTLINLVA